jgi:hypothetical protein
MSAWLAITADLSASFEALEIGDAATGKRPGSVALGARLFLSVTARCPRCSETISPWISMYPVFYLPFKNRPTRCPHCHVSLDEPVALGAAARPPPLNACRSHT